MNSWIRFRGSVWIAAMGLGAGAFTASAQDAPPAAAKAEPAAVQERLPRDYSSVRYCLTQYEVEHFSKLLDLSPEQHEIMMSMFTEVRRQVFEVQRPLSQAIDEMVEFFNVYASRRS